MRGSANAPAARPECVPHVCTTLARPRSPARSRLRYTAHPLWAEVKKEALSGLPAPPNMDKEIALVQAQLSS